MANIEPFKIAVPDSEIEDLKTRLSLARFPDELDEAAWDLGAPLSDIKRLTAYWKDEFDWRAAERKLNELPQFTTSITVEGFAPLKIHFIYQKSENPNAIPLLFVHGWPGSFLEVTKVLDGLTKPSTSSSGSGSGSGPAEEEEEDDDDNDNPSFDVVALSLPNFGFSSGPRERGFALEHYAELCHKLMNTTLGYTQYVTQGGDWGFYITRAISLLYPEHCKATHVNMDFGGPPTFNKNFGLALKHAVTPYTSKEKRGLERSKWFMDEGSGYRAQQSTKPQTLGYSLADSPVGLFAWIWEKLHDWTDSYPWTDDEICTWLAIYQFSTAGPAASLRIYYEVVHSNSPDGTTEKKNKITRDRVGDHIPHVKIGLSHSPFDLRVLPNTWTAKFGEIVFERYHDGGGHFLAWERPQNLIADLRDMFRRENKNKIKDKKRKGKGGAFGVVEGRNGY